ncbi:MAG: hypothetical protein ACI4XJ_08910 [Eubacteriales bacterium]
MEENVIQINVMRRIAERSGGVKAIVADNTEYTMQFLFDAEWQAYPAKTVLFVRDDGLCYPPVIMEGDSCKIPRINGTGHIRIGVTAGDIITTTPAEIRVLRSVLEASGQVLDKPDDNVWACVIEQLQLLNAAKLNPIPKTDDMTQPVGRDEQGRLWAPPSGGGGSGLPAITEEDEGRVLTASGGVAVWRELPKYTGEYSVTPSAESAQTLETAQKYLDDNVTVEKIPTYEVSNDSGGATLIIGNESMKA